MAPEGHALRDRLADWTTTVSTRLDGVWPEMPPGITDRPADTWEALLAIADAAGGRWLETARVACVELCKVVESREASLGVRLLSDLRTIFGRGPALHRDDPGPAHRPRGVPVGRPARSTARSCGLARRLTAYGVRWTKVKIGDASLRGYRREDLWDPWTPAISPPTGIVMHQPRWAWVLAALDS